MLTKKHIDQLKREVTIEFPPKRIISLVPSQTELLYSFGLEEEVVGITKFCIHPSEWFRSKQRIGGTKKVNHEAIARLQPDLIIANKEENTKEDIALLETRYPVWISDIKRYDDAIEMISMLGQLTDRKSQSNRLLEQINRAFANINLPTSRKRVLYVIWNEPIMAAGKDTFINEMLHKAGFDNAITSPTARYPELTTEDIISLNPDFIFLSSEPFPFVEKHIERFATNFNNSRIILVDGEFFSWFGSRMLLAPSYFQELTKQTE